MAPVATKCIKWKVETLTEVAEKYKTRGEFRNQDRLAYNAAVRLKILDQIC